MTLTRSERSKEVWSRPGYREKMSKIRKKTWKDPEFRRKVSESHKGHIVSEETRQKISEAKKNPTKKTRRKMSEAAKKRWENPEYKRKMFEVQKGRICSSETRLKISEAMSGENHPNYGKTGEEAPFYGKHHSTESKIKISEASKGRKISKETRKKISEGRKGMTFSPEHRKNLSLSLMGKPGYWTGKKRSPEDIEKFRKSHLGKKASKETLLKKRLAMLGKHDGNKNPAWRGGTARLPYTYEFVKLRPEIIKRDNFTCQKCKLTETELGYSLSVHHIDYNRDNNVEGNLVSLCRSCHSKTNYNRSYWEVLLTTLMEQKKPLKIPLVEPLSQNPTYSIIGGISDGY